MTFGKLHNISVLQLLRQQKKKSLSEDCAEDKEAIYTKHLRQCQPRDAQ